MRSLENIVTNAIRYTEKGGRIDVTSRKLAGRTFSPFAMTAAASRERTSARIRALFRGTSSRREEGWGSASIVKSVVDSHGWKIAIDSLPGRGTLVKISIPVGDGRRLGLRIALGAVRRHGKASLVLSRLFRRVTAAF
jgi:signal transduction histidine kinase